MVTGAMLAVTEAMTLGMPLEVWKTRQGAYPQEYPLESLRALHARGGWRSFYRGSMAKTLEAASKGAVLLYSKELILDVCEGRGMNRSSGLVGALGGAGGGIAQTVVMAPLTYVVTYKMKNQQAAKWSTWQVLSTTGLRAAYGSSVPVALRQASNWALRQGFADGITGKYREHKGAALSTAESVGCGLLGGSLACINQPFEILRIRMQARHAMGDTAANTTNTAKIIWAESGLRGFYAALVPRMCLSAYQTLFMVTFAAMIKEQIKRFDQRV